MDYAIAHYDNIRNIPTSVDSYLDEKPAVNFETIGIIENLRKNPSVYNGILECVVVSNKDTILVIACRIQPFNLLISHAKNLGSIISAVDYYINNQIMIPGIYGPLNEVNLFIEHWEKKTGEDFTTRDEYFQYALYSLKNKPEYIGDISIATEKHEKLLSEWTIASIREIIPTTTETFVKSCVSSFKKLLEKNRVFILDVDGVIVSMAAISDRAQKMQAINDVYTPPEYRGTGHATELCTFLADYVLNDCKNTPILWVRTTNKAAIHIYEKIGFEKVESMILGLK